MAAILVVAEADGGQVSEPSRELVTKALALRGSWAGEAGAVLIGAASPEGLEGLDFVYDAASSDPEGRYLPTDAERAALAAIDAAEASLVLVPNTTLGIDLAASIAAKRQVPMAGYCIALDQDGERLVARCQVYGGKLVAEMTIPPTGAVVSVIPGSWPAQAAAGSAPTRRSLPAEDSGTAQDAPMHVLEVLAAETGDVDITRADILVSVGRGLQGPENLDLAEELAEALGGVVSCSRPVVDAGWMPRSRQVGKSGQTVKPKVYLALGISGAPEHLQGMKDAELILAVNSDPTAPIFEVAHYGAVVDILDFMPALAAKIQERTG